MTAFIDCGCNGNCYPSNSCGGTNCKCKPAKEVCYSGPPLSCLGINPKDTIDVALQKINTFLCGQQFIDLVNNAIECQTIINCLPTTTTTSTTVACNRWQYNYLSFTCTLCEIIEYGSLYNSNPLTLDNFYQYGDIVITPYEYLGCDTGISDASIPDEGVTTCEEIDCIPTTTTSTTLNPALCKDQGLQALSIDGGSWVATDCLGESVGGLVPGDGGTYYTGCVNVTTLVLTNAEIKETIDC